MQPEGPSPAQLAAAIGQGPEVDLEWLLDSEEVRNELTSQLCSATGCPRLVARVAVATLARLSTLAADKARSALLAAATDKLIGLLAACRPGGLVAPWLLGFLAEARNNAEFRRSLRLIAEGKVPPAEIRAPHTAPHELAALHGLKVDLDHLGIYLAGEFDLLNERLDLALAYTIGQPRSRLCTLPARTLDFTGRDAEVTRLVQAIVGDGRASITAVVGMGGVGKTACALEAAWRAAECFPDGALFVDLGGFGPSPLGPAAALATLTAQIGPVGMRAADLAAAATIWRGQVAGRRLLVVLDNVRQVTQIRDLVPPEPAALLITSRVPIRLPGIRSLSLDALPTGEAMALLRGLLAGRMVADAELGALATACGGLPIALRAAAAFLVEHPGWLVADYLAALAGRRLPHLTSEDDPALDVATVLAFSIESLSGERPGLLERWRLLAVFPSDVDAEAAAAVWQRSPVEARDDLDRLLGRSLVQRDAVSVRYRLHDLYRELAEDGADAARLATARDRHAAHYCGVLGRADDLYRQGGDRMAAGLALFDCEWPNIEAGQAWCRAQMPASDAAARLAYDYTNAGAFVLSLRLPPARRIAWLEAAVDACRRLWHRQEEATALGNLGLARADLGETALAIALYEAALAISREIGDRGSEGAALGNLGNVWRQTGEVHKALEFYDAALAIARETGDRQTEGTVLGNLGSAWAALGEGGKAIALYEQHLAIARGTGDRRSEGALLWNLALAREDLGQQQYATELATAALASHRAVDHPFTASIESWLRERGIDPDEA